MCFSLTASIHAYVFVHKRSESGVRKAALVVPWLLNLVGHLGRQTHEGRLVEVTRGDLGLPTFTWMVYGHEPIHQRMQQRSWYCPFGQTVGSHIACVEPKQVLKDLSVEQLSPKLHVRKQRLLGWRFDERGGDGRVDALGVHV